MQRQRILVIENSIAVTGALQSVLRCSSYMSDEYDFVFLIPTRSATGDFIQQYGFKVYKLPMLEIRNNVLVIIQYFPRLLMNAFRLLSLSKEIQPDIIIVNDFYNLLPAVYRILGGRVPYLSYVRFMPSKFSPVLIKFWMWFHNRYAAHLIAVSEAVKREIPTSLPVSVVYNELPLDEVTYIRPGGSTILYPGNYIRGKGQEYAIQSFSKLARDFPDWKLRFIGGDMGLEKNRRFKEELIEQAHSLGIAGQVEFMGFTNQMKDEYIASAFILNFSESESFSLTCLEACYFGRAIIVTRCGGPEEIVDQGRSGYLVQVGNIDEMAAAMKKLMSDRSLHTEMGFFGFNLVRIKFSRSVIHEKMEKVFQVVLK